MTLKPETLQEAYDEIFRLADKALELNAALRDALYMIYDLACDDQNFYDMYEEILERFRELLNE